VLATLQRRLTHLEQVEVSRRYLRCPVPPLRRQVLQGQQCEDSIKDLIDQAIGKTGSWQCLINWMANKIKPDTCW
jgi:hypothetical protein